VESVIKYNSRLTIDCTKNKYSLKSRLIIWILLGNLLIWVGISAFIWFDTSNELDEWLTHISTTVEAQAVMKHEREDILSLLLWNLVWPFILGIPLLILTISFVVHIINKDLLTLGKAIENRDALSIELLNTNNLPNEVVPLVNKLNELFLRVKASVEKQNRFTADAAHELRTPMSAIRAQAQVAIMATDNVTKQYALKELMIGCDRSSHLVDQLLALARLEKTEKFHKSFEVINLEKLIKNLVANFSSTAKEKNQKIIIKSLMQQVTSMLSDEVLVMVMFRNLIDNALRYSPADSVVQITVGNNDGRHEVVIEDGGAGMTEVEISRLGERFFRVVTRDFSLGSGLGWSIVTQIATVLDFKIQVDRSPCLGGLRVKIHM
jgi:two-component system, OmpR family, sensor histidine kinase QseC